MYYFFDSYAIIEIIKNNQNYQKFEEFLVITNALNIAEVHYFLMEYIGEAEDDKAIQSLNINLLDVSKEIAIDASKLRFANKKLKLSYADCLGYILSKKNNLIFITGDDAFKNFYYVEFVK